MPGGPIDGSFTINYLLILLCIFLVYCSITPFLLSRPHFTILFAGGNTYNLTAASEVDSAVITANLFSTILGSSNGCMHFEYHET